MKVRRRSGATRRREATEDPAVDHVLDAMSAPELRAATRVVLDQLDDGVKAWVMDALLARGATAKSGWKPARPSPRIVEEAKSFSEAARQIGKADPDDVTEHARHQAARGLSAPLQELCPRSSQRIADFSQEFRRCTV